MPTEILFQRPLGGRSNIIDPQYLDAAHALAERDADAQKFFTNPEDKDQIVSLYNAVVEDGRMIREFPSDPKSVAARLGLPISDSAAQSIMQASNFQGAIIGSASRPDALPIEVICVAIVVVLCARSPEGDQQVIVDSSGILKL